MNGFKQYIISKAKPGDNGGGTDNKVTIYYKKASTHLTFTTVQLAETGLQRQV